MKLYVIDKYEKYVIIKKELEKLGVQNVEMKQDISHRINKTDYVVTFDFEEEYEQYQKINHLIILTTQTNPQEIYQMVTKLHTEDVIYLTEDFAYIAKRIQKLL